MKMSKFYLEISSQNREHQTTIIRHITLLITNACYYGQIEVALGQIIVERLQFLHWTEKNYCYFSLVHLYHII